MRKLAFIFCLLTLFSCVKQEEKIGNSKYSKSPDELRLAEYNDDVANLAQCLSLAMKYDNELGKVVRSESLNRFDGDVNVLFSDLSKKSISITTKSGNKEMRIDDYLSSFLTKTKTTEEKSVIDKLQEEYPLLQVAIPVHHEEWDGTTPLKVAYVPYPFDEKNTDAIPAITPEGEWVMLDANVEPDEPVIVLSQNERSSGFPPMVDTLIQVKPTLGPATPQNLKAVVANDYIELSWDKVSCFTYWIYRKGPNDADFSKLGSSNSEVYNDKAISANTVYFYYVVAVNLTINNHKFIEHVSDPSNTVRIQAPSIPDPLSYFNVVCQGENIEFRWNDDGIPDSRVIINYKDAVTQSDYSLLHTSLSSSVNWSYESIIKGRRVVYQARREHNVGLSNPIYSFIYPPYRNTAESSQVRVKSISIKNLNDVEAWYSGAPEFYIKIFKANTDANGNISTAEVGGEYRLAFSERTNSQEFDALVYSWLVDEQLGWSEAITIYMVEGDNDKDCEFQASAQIGIPDYAKLELSYTMSPRFDAKFSTSGQNCGRGTIYYFENPKKTLNFSNEIDVEVDDK